MGFPLQGDVVMLRRVVVGLVVLLTTGMVVREFFPVLSAAIQSRIPGLADWIAPDPKTAPVPFADYARAKLQRDLEAMQKTRRELAAEVGELVRKVREQEALRKQAEQLADQFRHEYHEVKAESRFPVEVHGRAYTEAELKSQLSMILAEAKGYEDACAKLRDVRQQAEAKIESLAVKINSTETQLVALAAKRDLIEANRLSSEGEALLAQVDELMHGNAQEIADNPVRTVRELLAVSARPAKTPTNAEAVEAFLASQPAAEPQIAPGQQPDRGDELTGSIPNEPSVEITERHGHRDGRVESTQKLRIPANRESEAGPSRIQLAGAVEQASPVQQEANVKRDGDQEKARPRHKPSRTKAPKAIFQQF
jgi:hypothetical protein